MQPEQSSYETRLRRVLQYVYDNPAGDLSLDRLADVAAMSRFHFHRVYRAMAGEPIAQAVRRLRLHRAAFLLLQTDRTPAEIAALVGYDNAQSFARAFKSQYGQTPNGFRRQGVAERDSLFIQIGDPDMYPCDIRDLPETRCAGLMHQGSYQLIGRAFVDLAARFSSRGLWSRARGMLAVYYDSPADVAEDDLRSAACIRVADGFDMPADMTAIVLPGGPHMVMTVKGPYTSLPAAWDHLYGTALSTSGRLPADSAPFEVYLNDPTDTAPEELLTEICVPLSPEN